MTTVTLTSQGTITLDLSTFGTVTVGSPFFGAFIPGAVDPVFVLESAQVSTTISATAWTAINSVGFVNLDAGSPLALISDVVSPQSTGSTVTLPAHSFGYFAGKAYARNEQNAGGFFQVSAGNAGTLVTQGTVAALGTSHTFTVAPNFLFSAGADVGLVVDPQGIVYDSTSGSYVTTTFLPTLNAAPPAGANAFDGGFANTTSGHNYMVVSNFSTLSPFGQLPSLVEETNRGTASAVYSFAFNDTVNVPGDVYDICGNTPNGFFFTTANAIVEVNPVLREFTVYKFVAQDTSASDCLTVVLPRGGLYAATKDTAGNWWLTNSLNQFSCGGGQTSFVFAKSTNDIVSRALTLTSIAGSHGSALSLGGTYNYQNTTAPTALDIGYVQPDNSINWVPASSSTIGTTTPAGAFSSLGGTLA